MLDNIMLTTLLLFASMVMSMIITEYYFELYYALRLVKKRMQTCCRFKTISDAKAKIRLLHA